jgi:hypothetical protein
MTEQEQALKAAKKQFGTTAFTEDFLNYRRIGFKLGKKTITGIGDTWSEAFRDIEFKTRKENAIPNIGGNKSSQPGNTQ